MSLSIRWDVSPEALGEVAWTGLHSRSPSATVFQSWEWLTAWWSALGEGLPWVASVWEGEELVGAAALFRDAGGTLRFIGEEHADYGQVLVTEDREDVLLAILGAIFARRSEWRALALDAVRLDTQLATQLRRFGAWTGDAVACPRADFAVRSPAELLGKESLRRHEKKLRKEGALEVLHLEAANEIEPYLEAFFQQHCERWALTRWPSLFLNPDNQRFYRELVRRARSGGPVVFTVVKAGEQIAAMHLGLRSEGDLIWYKPTFDPRMTKSGPGEVLLAELIRKAHTDEARGLDFTRGGEAFKSRFASEVRQVACFRARGAACVHALARSWAVVRPVIVRVVTLARVRAPIVVGVQVARRVLAIAKSEGPVGLAGRISAALRRIRKPPLVFFTCARSELSQGVDPVTDLTVRHADTLAEILEVLDVRDGEYRDALEQTPARLASNRRLWVGQVDGRTACYGWEARGATELPLTEVGGTLESAEELTTLVDFHTLPQYRRRGYYRILLSTILSNLQTEFACIYSQGTNAGSCSGIEKAGFRRFAQMAARPTVRLRPIPPLRVRIGKGVAGSLEFKTTSP